MEEGEAKLKLLSGEEKAKINCLKSVVLKDQLQAETFVNDLYSWKQQQQEQSCFDWAAFSAAVMEWEAYTQKLYHRILASFPHWRNYGSLFLVPELGEFGASF